MAGMSTALSRKDSKIDVVSNAVDTDIFCAAENRQRLRERIGIKRDSIAVLISASSFSDSRKGTRYAVDAIKQILLEKPHIILVGREGHLLKSSFGKLSVSSLGYQDDQKEMAKIYAAADIFLFPSLQENQPLAILESLSCGTPVVAFNTGGIPEIFDHNRHGYIADFKSVEDLARGVISVITLIKKDSHLRDRIRDYAVSKFNFERYYNGHLNLYQQMLGNG